MYGTLTYMKTIRINEIHVGKYTIVPFIIGELANLCYRPNRTENQPTSEGIHDYADTCIDHLLELGRKDWVVTRRVRKDGGRDTPQKGPCFC